MKLRYLALALLLSFWFSGARAVITFVDPTNDAGSTIGSIESISGAALFTTINGTSGSFLLEALDPGLLWSNFKLEVYDITTEAVQQSPAVTASLNGTPFSTVSFATGVSLPPGLIGLNGLFNVYTFTFGSLALAGNANYSVNLGGFFTNVPVLGAIADTGGAVLTTTAVVPEPSTLALLMAGLVAAVWLARRRSPRT